MKEDVAKITTSIVLIPNNIGSLYGFAYSVIESMNIWMCYNRFKIMSSITYIQNETVKYMCMNTIIWRWLMSDTLCLATLTNHSLSSVIHYIGKENLLNLHEATETTVNTIDIVQETSPRINGLFVRYHVWICVVLLSETVVIERIFQEMIRFHEEAGET